MGEARFSRRYFFYGSLLAGAVPRGGFGSVPSLGALGYKSFNDKLNIAVVGCGIRAPQILTGITPTENVVALCDVHEEKAARTYQAFPNVKKYVDYRKMLDAEGSNIDGVMIATPDHTHTPIALACMQRGKHVYCEKPLTRTVWEARLLADAAVKYKVATQMGNQGWSHEGTRTACEILWSGDIGEVREVRAWTGVIYGGQPNIPASGPETQPVPKGVDWDLWIGPAPMRGFNPVMVNQWRAFRDYSTGGSLGDWLVHNLGPAHLALQLGKVSPTSVECVAVEEKTELLWPLRAHLVFEFPARGSMPPVTIHAFQNMTDEVKIEGVKEGEQLLPPMNNLAEKGRPFYCTGDGLYLIGDQLGIDGLPPSRGGARAQGGPPPRRAGEGGPPRDAAMAKMMANRARIPGNGAIFFGSKGYMATSARGEGTWLLPASRWKEYRLPPQVLQRGINHMQDWVRACKGGAPGVSEFGIATRYIEWLALGAIALQVPGKLLWDGPRMRFTNSAEANKLLRPYLRKGWELKL
ncbi:MAG: Gfo/Idh/MocA family protein [Bryobacteraceae bacterium]